MPEPSSSLNRLSRADEPAQNRDRMESQACTVNAWNTLVTIPADNGILCSTTNGNQERSNPRPVLRPSGRSRWSTASWAAGGIASEANALGKAEGYADGGTVLWKVEAQLGVQTL